MKLMVSFSVLSKIGIIFCLIFIQQTVFDFLAKINAFSFKEIQIELNSLKIFEVF
jgi:hypothetical protein